MRKIFLLSLLFFVGRSIYAANAPVLFFSDIVQGPSSGNSDTTFSSTGGAYVTLYGNYLDGFTSVKLNGVSCLTVVSNPSAWLWYERMVVKIGTACTSGNWSITTSGGTFTGPMKGTLPGANDFTVASGNIYYVSTTGNDSTGTGSFSSPWATFYHAKHQMTDGDMFYAENGTSATTTDPDGLGVYTLFNASSGGGGCGATKPIDFLAYPGATVTLGTVSLDNATRINAGTGCAGNFVFAELTARGLNTAFNTADSVASTTNTRFVGNDVSCPSANQETGCLADGSFGLTADTNVVYFGNKVHDVGTGSNGLQHAIYNGNDTSLVDAWNLIYAVGGACRGIQVFSSTSGFVYSDIHLHDNIIHDTGCDGIGLYLVAPHITTGVWGGGIEIYNNVIWNSGLNTTAGADTSCIYLTSAETSTAGTSQVYNNSLYNCELGSAGSSAGFQWRWDAGPPSTAGFANFRNNIIYIVASSGVPYVNNQQTASTLTGSNNIAFGLGTVGSGNCGNCSNLTGWVQSNPSYTNTSTTGCPDSCPTDLHLSSAGSPANGSGNTSAPVPTYDITGLVRPSPPSMGAYEFSAGTNTPSAPVGLTIQVQ